MEAIQSDGFEQAVIGIGDEYYCHVQLCIATPLMYMVELSYVPCQLPRQCCLVGWRNQGIWNNQAMPFYSSQAHSHQHKDPNSSCCVLMHLALGHLLASERYRAPTMHPSYSPLSRVSLPCWRGQRRVERGAPTARTA